MRLWRTSLWLLPLATLIPLGFFAYQLSIIDLNTYFAGVGLAALILLLGIPNAVILVASTVGAELARKNRPLPGLIIAAAVCAWQLSPIVWAPEFWRSHERAAHLLLFAVPGTVAFFLGLSGLVLLRDHSRVVAGVVAVLLAVPFVSSTAGVVVSRVEVARYCPEGPAIDLTFSGLESAHFTTSCGIPDGVSTLAGCTQWQASLEMYDVQSWNLSFAYSETTMTSDIAAYRAPYLIVGDTTGYGGALGWRGEYSFDAGKHCAGTVDADLFAGSRGAEGGHVHVHGRFQAP